MDNTFKTLRFYLIQLYYKYLPMHKSDYMKSGSKTAIYTKQELFISYLLKRASKKTADRMRVSK